MTVAGRPAPTVVVHFTHVSHLPTIVERGLLSGTAAQQVGLVQTEVGNKDIKAMRRSRAVPVPPGGVVADYAPFYYAPRSPMMYVIDRGGVSTYAGGCDDLVYLVTTVERLTALPASLVFTDRNAVLGIAEFSADLDRLESLIDWPLMGSTMWNNTDAHPDRKERRMAECLVHRRVPWPVFTEIVAKTRRARWRLRQWSLRLAGTYRSLSDPAGTSNRMERTSMITQGHGNLLDADVDALVNTVNTVGVMGKGIALQFRRAYPEMYRAYERAVKAGDVGVGRMHVWPTEALTGPRYVINFPTKGHWRARSRLADVERGLDDLVRVVRKLCIKSLAVPPLGCGNGGLDWRHVEPRIRGALAALDSDVHVLLYPPGRTPNASAMRTGTGRPAMTSARAALIRVLARYSERALEASLVEVQKLLYFLQAAGEPLRLNYVKAQYGPYSDNLRHVLSNLEGHYLSGFGDGSARVADAELIQVLPGADELAGESLATHPETVERIARVLQLLEGFESAYGMELLASVHWIAHETPEAAGDPDLATRLVRDWTPRKGRMFTAEHIRVAWDALHDRGWLPASAHLAPA